MIAGTPRDAPEAGSQRGHLVAPPPAPPPIDSPRWRTFLWILVIGGTALPLLTLPYVPTPFNDVQLYASIARARQLYGVGIPTITWHSPAAVDHIPFYGPVFFDLCALALSVLGVGVLSFRLVSVLGTALVVLGTVLLARQFSGARNGPLLAVALVLLSPEVNFGMGTGAMHMLAVGFEVLAMAVFVRAFDRRRGGARYGAAAGLLLAMAALTTPRSYQFIFGFVCAGLIPAVLGSGRLAVRYRLMAALLTLASVMSSWAVWSHGSVAAWARYMWFIFVHEDTDVAILPTAVREFSFHWSGVVTLAAVLAGGFVAAWAIRKRHGWRDEGRNAALSFLVTCAWIEFVATSVTLNYTFTIGEYIALPLFAVVLSWPRDRLGVPRRVAAAGVVLLLSADLGILAYRYACIFSTWESRDPAPLNAFIARHVPPGSAVAGPESPFFFPVERSGSRYRTLSPRSWADWARWVPLIEPKATALVRRFPQPRPAQRFVIWVKDDALPVAYACAAPYRVATFEAPPVDPSLPRWMRAALKQYPGYPSASLYRLPDGCPKGYDPTGVGSRQ